MAGRPLPRRRGFRTGSHPLPPEIRAMNEERSLMMTLLYLLLFGVAALVALKIFGALLGMLLPVILIVGLLAVPLGMVVLVGWGVVALLGRNERDPG